MSRQQKKASRTLLPPRDLDDQVRLESSAPHVTFLTFGAGNNRFRRAAVCLANEAAACGWFRSVRLFTDQAERPRSLSAQVDFAQPALSARERDFIAANRRGYGYWLWKPIIVRDVLAALPENDILLYADGGCELSGLGSHRLRFYASLAARHGGLFFRIPHIERTYTKSEVLSFLSATQEEAESDQIQATLFLVKNTAENRSFVQRWLEICGANNMALLNDALDPARQDPAFVEHRHDQSILSLLVKRTDMKVIEREDQFDKRLYRMRNSWIFLYPLHARRARRIRLTHLVSRLSTERACRANLELPLLFRLRFALQSALALRLDFAELRELRALAKGRPAPDPSDRG